MSPAASLFLLSTQNLHKDKSFWVYYAAHRRLAETKPIIWFYKANYYLFVEEGVYMPPPVWDHDDFRCIM